jgi:hypothetical protein
MPKRLIHTNDLPAWAVRKEKLPQSYLGFLREAAYPSPDGKGMISLEDRMLRQHWDAMLTGSSKARDWLLREVIKHNKAVLAAAPEQPRVAIDGVHYFQPLGPVLEILGCVKVSDPEEGSEALATIALSPWFLEALQKRCRAEKLAPVLAWQDAGGQQTPRIRDRDRFD